MARNDAGLPEPVSPRKLAAELRRAGRLFLFFDYDGTLVPIAPTPAAARPDPALVRLIGRLAAAPGVRVALVSGRDLDDVAGMFPLPQIYLAGCHGAELQFPGGRKSAPAGGAGQALAQLADRLQRKLAGRQGFFVERKKYSLALHYRLADPAEVPAALAAFRESARDAVRAHGLVFTTGKKVLELRPRDVDKGRAVRRLLEEYPGALPVYLGDDVTDEDAFAALAGSGVTVLVAPAPRPSAARYLVRDPAEVRELAAYLAGDEAGECGSVG